MPALRQCEARRARHPRRRASPHAPPETSSYTHKPESISCDNVNHADSHICTPPRVQRGKSLLSMRPCNESIYRVRTAFRDAGSGGAPTNKLITSFVITPPHGAIYKATTRLASKHTLRRRACNAQCSLRDWAHIPMALHNNGPLRHPPTVAEEAQKMPPAIRATARKTAGRAPQSKRPGTAARNTRFLQRNAGRRRRTDAAKVSDHGPTTDQPRPKGTTSLAGATSWAAWWWKARTACPPKKRWGNPSQSGHDPHRRKQVFGRRRNPLRAMRLQNAARPPELRRIVGATTTGA